MIDIEKLRAYYERRKVFMSEHASNRCAQREITQKDLKNCVMTGEIIEQYPGDFPSPSCLIFGRTVDGRIMHTVASDEGAAGRIITAYFPAADKFKDDFKTRKEH